MTSQTGKQIIIIHTKSNFWEYNIRNIFLEKLAIKYGGVVICRPFYKKSKLSISLNQQSGMLWSLFLLHV